MIVVARGSSEAQLPPSAARPKTCAAGSPPAMKALLWRAPCATWRCAIRSHRNSADLTPQLREVLGNIPVGHFDRA